MGNRPSAEVFYGISCGYGNELVQNEDEYNDGGWWEKKFYSRIDVPYPGGWDDDNKPELVATGCIIDHHGFLGENPGQFLAIRESRIPADPWNGAVGLNGLRKTQNDEILADWDAKILAFCKLMEIPWQQPKWQLVCNYG